MKLLDTKLGNLGYLLHFHRQVHSGHWHGSQHKILCLAVVDVRRMWIDRCIKQPSNPISHRTNAQKGRESESPMFVWSEAWFMLMSLRPQQISIGERSADKSRERLHLCHRFIYEVEVSPPEQAWVFITRQSCNVNWIYDCLLHHSVYNSGTNTEIITNYYRVIIRRGHL